MVDLRPISAKYNLKPYLIAHANKSFLLFPFYWDEMLIRHQIGNLFTHFLPNFHAMIFVRSTFDLQSFLVRHIDHLYGRRVQFVQQQPGDPIGTTLLQGISHALEQDAKNIIQLSGFQNDEFRFLPEMLHFADRYDLIIGSRFLMNQEFSCPQKQMQFRIDRWMNRAISKSILAGRVMDVSSNVRCWSSAGLELVLSKLKWRHPSLLHLEMTYLSHKLGLRITEFPIAYQPTVMSQVTADTSPSPRN